MTLVTDSNLLLALVVNLDYSEQAEKKFREWTRYGTAIVAPTLWIYEATSSLRKLVGLKVVSEPQAFEALAALRHLQIRSMPPTFLLRKSALEWAERLKQLAAYDAAYIALADHLDCPFWTADRRLARNAKSLKLDWVHSIHDE